MRHMLVYKIIEPNFYFVLSLFYVHSFLPGNKVVHPGNIWNIQLSINPDHGCVSTFEGSFLEDKAIKNAFFFQRITNGVSHC